MQEKNRNFSILKQRILLFLDFVGDTKKDFYTKTGISNGILSQPGGISEDNLLKFLNIYTDINLNWLFTGCGHMSLEDGSSQSLESNNSKYYSSKNMNNQIFEKNKTIEEIDIQIADLTMQIDRLIENISDLKSIIQEKKTGNA